jgi:hypothetical protein
VSWLCQNDENESRRRSLNVRGLHAYLAHR